MSAPDLMGWSGDRAYLEMIAGAGGIIIGRNAWQRANPKEMIQALCRLAHTR